MIAGGVVLNERYRLLRELARGGMAVVWEALDTLLDRPVAVKVLHPQFANDPEFLERFRREARAAASLAHPNIVAIFDVGEDRTSGTPFIVMELAEGESLKERIRRSGLLPEGEVRETGAALAGALEYAHRRGVVHRDVKPQNVLVGADGRVRLADFGIAQALAASGLTRTGAVMGSVHYLAPELARGQPATPAADVYGLGVVLYEMATGLVPFTGETELAVALAHAQQRPVPPRTLNPRLAPSLEAAILRALAKRPEDRFGSAAELGRALSAPSAGQPTARMVGAPAGAAAATAYRAAAPRAASPASSPPSTHRQPSPPPGRPAPPPRRGAGNGFIALMLVLAAILLALGAGFFGLTWVGREGGSPPAAAEPSPSPAPSPGSKPVAAASPAVTATATPTPPAEPTATPAVTATPEPTRPSPTATPRPPTPTPTPRPIAVPNLIGRQMKDALAALEAVGLTARVVGVNVNAEEGRVVATTPEPGAPLPPGGTVTISVGTGQVVVPGVAGRRGDEAARLLTEAGLRFRVRETANDRPRGTALGTTPPAGEVVPRGFEVELLVSSGR